MSSSKTKPKSIDIALVVLGILVAVLIGYIVTVHVLKFNCEQIDDKKCIQTLQEKDLRVLSPQEYKDIEASPSTCASISGYKLLADTDFRTLEEKQASPTTCSSLSGYKLLKDTDYNLLNTNQASTTTCANIPEYKFLPQSEYTQLLQNQTSVDACSSLPGYTLLDTAKMRSRLHPFVMQNIGAENKCLTVQHKDDSESVVTFDSCDLTGTTKDQIFLYDISTNTVKNIDGMCLDDGGDSTKGGKKWKLSSVCSTRNDPIRSQQFRYNQYNQSLENVSAQGLCLDSNFGKNLHYWNCEPSNNNQKWNFLGL